MRNKGIKTWLATAVVTFGIMTMSAYAAEGWALSNNTWVYLNGSGNRVTNEWKKGADSLWRYLNSSGEMAISTWADNDYYVDANGIMLVNQWLKTVSPYDRSGEEY